MSQRDFIHSMDRRGELESFYSEYEGVFNEDTLDDEYTFESITLRNFCPLLKLCYERFEKGIIQEMEWSFNKRQVGEFLSRTLRDTLRERLLPGRMAIVKFADHIQYAITMIPKSHKKYVVMCSTCGPRRVYIKNFLYDMRNYWYYMLDEKFMRLSLILFNY